MIPGSPEWQRLITASKVAAILGVSPWASPRSTWHAMHGDLPREAQTTAQSRGHYLEPAILAWWRDQHGVVDGEFAEQPEYGLGDWAAATPDMVACHPVDDNVLVEAKSTNQLDEWGDPGTDVIPAYYLCQTYWQMHVSGVHRCYVPIIGPRLEFAEYVVDYDAAIGADLEQRMRAFYDSLAAHEPPALDDTVATFNAVRKVHKDIDAGAEIELTEAEAVELVAANGAVKAWEARLRLAKSTVLDRMGRAQYAVCNGQRIARRQADGPERTKFVPVAKTTDFATQQGDAA